MSIDPANRVVMQAKILRETFAELTPDEARYVAHCMVRHAYQPPTNGQFMDIEEFHRKQHDRPQAPEDHTHLNTGWPK